MFAVFLCWLCEVFCCFRSHAQSSIHKESPLFLSLNTLKQNYIYSVVLVNYPQWSA